MSSHRHDCTQLNERYSELRKEKDVESCYRALVKEYPRGVSRTHAVETVQARRDCKVNRHGRELRRGVPGGRREAGGGGRKGAKGKSVNAKDIEPRHFSGVYVRVLQGPLADKVLHLEMRDLPTAVVQKFGLTDDSEMVYSDREAAVTIEYGGRPNTVNVLCKVYKGT